MKWTLYATSVVMIASVIALAGCATSKQPVTPTAKKASMHTVVAANSSPQLTVQEVTSDLTSQGSPHNIRDIRVLTLKNANGMGYAFASFKKDGILKYANILSSRQDGTGTGIFRASTKGDPIQADQQVAAHGYTFITGVVVGHPTVQTIVITFKNGSVIQTPVHNGLFWFDGQVGTSQSDAYLKHMIGVATNGDTVLNKGS